MERAAPKTWRIAVLTSGHGRGSNLLALQRCFSAQALPVEIAFATASAPTAPVAGLCAELGIPCHILKPRPQDGFEAQLISLCGKNEIDLIALAGFMSLLSETFLRQIGRPVLNIHPALLPQYGGKGMYGLRVHEAVLENLDVVSGASVHLVDPLYDHGEVIAQEKVDISACHTAEDIAARVLEVEHRIYAPAIYRYLSTRVQ